MSGVPGPVRTPSRGRGSGAAAESAPNSAASVFRQAPAELLARVHQAAAAPATAPPPAGRHTWKRLYEEVKANWTDIVDDPRKAKKFDPNAAVIKLNARIEKLQSEVT